MDHSGGGRGDAGLILADWPKTMMPGFGGLDADEADYQRAKFAVLPIPYDATTSYRTGTRDGPEAILSASHNMELFDEELLSTPAELGIATLLPVEVDARGPAPTLTEIQKRCAEPIRDRKFLLSLGGEHSLTIGCLDAQIGRHGSDLSVLQIDAHADLRTQYQGSPLSHACVMSRVLERCPAVQVGIRSLSAKEHEQLRERSNDVFFMSAIRQNPDWVAQAVDRLADKVYLSIDLDGFDPSVCPGVGTPEPGGLGWWDVLELLKYLFSNRFVIGADIVECLPGGSDIRSPYLAARLAYKIMAYRQAAGQID